MERILSINHEVNRLALVAYGISESVDVFSPKDQTEAEPAFDTSRDDLDEDDDMEVVIEPRQVNLLNIFKVDEDEVYARSHWQT